VIRKLIHALVSAAAIFTMAAAVPVAAQSRTIVDMAGRKISIGHVHRVWAAYPPVNYLVYAIDPSLLIGWVGPLPEQNKKFIAKPYRDLPVVGGWFGEHTPNMEVLAKMHPDLALVWDQSLVTTPPMLGKLQSLQIPVVAVKLFRLSDYPEALRFLGRVLDRQKRAGELASYIEKSMAEMKAFSSSIPEKDKLSVYYAIGPEGLKNDCEHMPFLDEATELAGGRNAHHCRPRDRVGQNIDMEQLLLYNPDVIITQEDLFYAQVYTNPRYAELKAVRNHRVYRIPNQPFNWLNYPPSFMRAVGIRWLAWKLYPQRYPTQKLEAETQRLFNLFIGVNLSAAEARALLN
jgi:iron complex transport system substrate-binding protein